MNAASNEQRKITRDTLIPVGTVVTAIAVLVGGILWLTEIRSIAAQNSREILKIEDTLDKLNRENFILKQRLFDRINSQDKRLARIEGKLEVIYDTLKEKKGH